MRGVTNAVGILVEPIPVGDGSKTFIEPEKLLFCQYSYGGTNQGLKSGGGWKTTIGIRTNADIEPTLMYWGEGAGRFALEEASLGIDNYKIPEGVGGDGRRI